MPHQPEPRPVEAAQPPAPMRVVRDAAPQLQRAETPTARTGVEKTLDSLQQMSSDWAVDDKTHIGSPTTSMLKLATPPDIAPARAAATSPKRGSIRSTLRPPAPPPGEAVTSVRLPPHPVPSIPTIEVSAESRGEALHEEGGSPERSTRPGFCPDESELGAFARSSPPPKSPSSPPPTRANSAPPAPASPRLASEEAMPGWLRRRREEERRLEHPPTLGPVFAEPPSASACGERDPSELRRRLALRVGLLVGAIVTGLGVTIALVL